MKKRTVVLAIALTIITAVIVGVFLWVHWQTTHPVELIHLFKAQNESFFPGSGGWGTNPTDPYPSRVQITFFFSDRLFFSLRTSHHIKDAISFTKYTYYNTTSEIETQVGSSSDLGPFDPGGAYLVAFENPWPVPEEPGIYQLRVYVGEKVVAWALFSVR